MLNYHTKNSDLQWSQPFLYIRARNADVHHNLNVSNPVPKVYTIYDITKIELMCYCEGLLPECSAGYLELS